ncbi:MAG: hypothetical protein IPK97_05820 [Ahniella sp.]|nr:hypothetical protein [Ahniella sp.]
MADRQQVPRMDAKKRVVVFRQQVVVRTAPLLVGVDARLDLRQVIRAADTAHVAASRFCRGAKTCEVIVDALTAGRLHADELRGPLVKVN